ncbi:alpha/beta hydrolase fold domain-containing protein [Rubrobacter marinus]|uniref:Alpha/beta hydrolase fold domain-containing protein n=1 Tax=Rubrobacter marinus TaxID=2653852 RepID=A0A6G8PYD2_9ACTN|nr:alpha/beta hydrolase [Rubrobacter marinus]QIN79147.1 alpha/beta hydrolase fold domain-containing protein [Rubrobacter marinus]
MKSTLSARQRLELRAARLLCTLPPRAQVRLSGRPPVRVDGQTLEPDLQLALSVLERRGAPPLETMPPAEAREAYRRQTAVSGGEPVPVGAVRDLTVQGAEGRLSARHYAPDEPGGPHPLVVFFHGGGFVIGDLDTHDAPCRLLCRHAGAHVLAVDYRLAPEHPFPAAVEDGRAAFRWALAHAAELGADADRVAVAGDSAGGNIAAVVSWQAAREGGSAPVLQVLVYPATNMAEHTRSHELFGGGFLLTRELLEWFAAQYVAGADPSDPRLSVLRAGNLSGAAPALVVTAGFDPLRDEGEAYADGLRAAGVPVVLRRFPGLIHSFFNAVGTSRVSREAVIEIAGATRALLAGRGSSRA